MGPRQELQGLSEETIVQNLAVARNLADERFNAGVERALRDAGDDIELRRGLLRARREYRNPEANREGYIERLARASRSRSPPPRPSSSRSRPLEELPGQLEEPPAPGRRPFFRSMAAW